MDDRFSPHSKTFLNDTHHAVHETPASVSITRVWDQTRGSNSAKLCVYLLIKPWQRCSGWRNSVDAGWEINLFFLLWKAQISPLCCPLDSEVFHRRFGGLCQTLLQKKKATLRELLKSAHCDSQLRLHRWDKPLTDLPPSELLFWSNSSESVFCFLSNLTFTVYYLCNGGWENIQYLLKSCSWRIVCVAL